MPSHPIAHMEAKDILPTTPKLVIIQHIQAAPYLEPPVKDEEEPNVPTTPMQEAWSEDDLDEHWEDTLGWETQDDDEGVSDLTILDISSFLPMAEQHGSDRGDSIESAREVVIDFEQRNIVFRDIE